MSHLCASGLLPLQEQRIRANPRATAAHCLWSQELWRQINWFYEKRCLWNARTEDDALPLTHVYHQSTKKKKGWKCEMWGVNNVTALNIRHQFIFKGRGPFGRQRKAGGLSGERLSVSAWWDGSARHCSRRYIKEMFFLSSLLSVLCSKSHTHTQFSYLTCCCLRKRFNSNPPPHPPTYTYLLCSERGETFKQETVLKRSSEKWV